MPRLLLALLVLLLAVPVRAQAPDALVDEFLDATGITGQALMLADEVELQAQGLAAQLPQAVREPFRRAYSAALRREVIGEGVREYIAAVGAPDSLRAVIAWLEQPLVRRMPAVDGDALRGSDAAAALRAYTEKGTFPAYTVTPEREAQVDRYFAATGVDAASVDLYLDVSAATAGFVAALDLGRETLEVPAADSLRTLLRAQLEDEVRASLRASALYAFRAVPDEDLEAYLTLLEHPIARFSVQFGLGTIRTVIVESITEASAAFQRGERLDGIAGTSDVGQSARGAASTARQLLDAGADGIALRQFAEPYDEPVQLLRSRDSEAAMQYGRLWGESFGAEALRGAVIDALVGLATTDELEAALAWFQCPEVAKAVGLLRHHVDPARRDALIAGLSSLRPEDIDPERMAVVAVLMERTNPARASDHGLLSRVAAFQAAYQLAPADLRPVIQKAIAVFQGELSTNVVEGLKGQQLYLYYALRELTLEELAAYTDAFKAHEGRWYIDVMQTALERAIERQGERLVAAAERVRTGVEPAAPSDT